VFGGTGVNEAVGQGPTSGEEQGLYAIIRAQNTKIGQDRPELE
jgi:hypothetical protein